MAGQILFGMVALGFSFFYGCKAVTIFVSTKNEKGEELPQIKEKTKLLPWKAHQFWLNFVGSLTGWAATYYLVFVRILPSKASFSFAIEDTVPLLIALLGITGLLPYTLSKFTSVK